MNGINRIFILGHLGSDPEMLTAKNGHAYANLNIATHRSIRNEEGKKELTDWHSVRVWGKTAELCHKYLTKGQPVFVEGYLSTYKQAKEGGDGQKKLSIQAIRVDFLRKGSASEVPTAEEGP